MGAGSRAEGGAAVGRHAPLLRVEVLWVEEHYDEREREIGDDLNLFVKVLDARVELFLPDFVQILNKQIRG